MASEAALKELIRHETDLLARQIKVQDIVISEAERHSRACHELINGLRQQRDELLEALRQCVTNLPPQLEYKTDAGLIRIQRITEIANAAIAKAEGRE